MPRPFPELGPKAGSPGCHGSARRRGSGWLIRRGGAHCPPNPPHLPHPHPSGEERREGKGGGVPARGSGEHRGAEGTLVWRGWLWATCGLIVRWAGAGPQNCHCAPTPIHAHLWKGIPPSRTFNTSPRIPAPPAHLLSSFPASSGIAYPSEGPFHVLAYFSLLCVPALPLPPGWQLLQRRNMSFLYSPQIFREHPFWARSRILGRQHRPPQMNRTP